MNYTVSKKAVMTENLLGILLHTKNKPSAAQSDKTRVCF